MRTAIILGATGLTGQKCLNLLLEDPDYEKVMYFGRREIKVNGEELVNAKLEQHIVDLDKMEKFSEHVVADDVFCCLGTTRKKAGSKSAFRKVDLEYPVSFAKIASANKCKQFLVISAPESSPKSPFFYGRVKGEMESLVKRLTFNGTYIFRPSLLIGDREEFRFGEGMALKLFKAAPWLLVGSMKRMKPIEASVVAKAMIIAAKKELGGQHVYSSHRIQNLVDTNTRESD